MIKEKETVLRNFLILVDVGVISLAYVLAFLLDRLFGDGRITLTRFGLALVFGIPYWCLSLYANGLYQSLRTRTYLEILWAIIKSAAITFFLMGTFIFLLKRHFMSRRRASSTPCRSSVWALLPGIFRGHPGATAR